MRKILLIFVFLILFSSTVSAMNLDEYDVNVFVSDNQLVVNSTIVFEKSLTGNFGINLPADAREISVYLNDELISEQDWTNNLKIYLNQTNVLKYNYVTSARNDKKGFFYHKELPHNIDLFKINLHLDSNIHVKDVKNQENVKAIYPEPMLIGSDGESTFINWEFENVVEGDLVTVFAKFNHSHTFSWGIYLLMLVILALIVSLTKRKKKIVYSGPRKVKKKSKNPLGIDLISDDE